MDLGIITKSDLKTRYGKALNKMFSSKKSLHDIGKENMSALANGLDAGIPEADSVLKNYKVKYTKVPPLSLTAKAITQWIA